MPGARRNPTKNIPSGRVPTNVCQSSIGSVQNVSITEEKKSNDGMNGRLLAPKHVPIPAIPVDGQLTFEALSFGISIVCASLQLLNLYRTVWWLPQSYNEYSMVLKIFIHYLHLYHHNQLSLLVYFCRIFI